VDPETHRLSEQATLGSRQQQASGSRPHTWIQRLTIYQSRPHRAVVSSRPQAAGRKRGSRDSQSIRAGHIGQSSAAGLRQQAAHVDPETHKLSERATLGSRQQQASGSGPHTWIQRLTLYQSRPHWAVVSSRPQAAGRTRGSRDSQSIIAGHIGQSSAAGLRQQAAHVDPETH